MRNLFNNPNKSDMKFKLKRRGDYDPDKCCPSDDPNYGYDLIYCHKWFAEENCKYLKEMFANSLSENEMEIKGYSYKTYFHFIQYLYTDSIKIQDIEVLIEMLSLAEEYSEEELKTLYVSIIKPIINVENVCILYGCGIRNRSTDLEEYCFEFMSENMKTIIETKGYQEMDGNYIRKFNKFHFAMKK